jgi:hypothetical protein
MDNIKEYIEAGACAGRAQAFALIASRCSADQALTLKQLKESRAFEKFGLTWDDFCRNHVGLSRSQADRIIARLDEFGEAYFRLARFARISDEAFREVAPQVTAESIDIEGEPIPLTPRNAPKIRAAIRAIQNQVRQARRRLPPVPASVVSARIEIDELLDRVQRLDHPLMTPSERAALHALAADAARKWSDFASEVKSRA